MREIIDKVILLIDNQNYNEAFNHIKDALKSSSENNAELYAYRALIHTRKGEYIQAKQVINIVYSLNKDLSIIHIVKGDIYLNNNNYNAALEHYKKAIDIKPKDAFTFLNLRHSLEKLRNSYKDYKDFEKIINQNSLIADEIYFSIGLSNASFGKHEVAVKYYIKAAELNPSCAYAAYFNIGSCFTKLEMYEEANKYFDKIIELNPLSFIAYSAKGNSLNSIGKYNEAIKYFDKAIELNPYSAEAYFASSRSLNSLKKYGEAIKYIDKAIELNPYSAEAYIEKGISLNALGKHKKAYKCFNKAIERYPGCAYRMYYDIGSSLGNVEKHEEAHKIFEVAIELNPSYDKAYFANGRSLHLLGEYEKAIKNYDKAIELNPSNSLAYCGKGGALNSLEKFEEALRNFKKAIKLDPTNAIVYNEVGIYYSNTGKYSEASKKYKKAIKLDPKSAYYSNLAGSLLYQGNYYESLKYSGIALNLAPDTAAFYLKGSAHYILGNHDKAMESLTKSIELFQENPLSYCKRGTLLKEKGHIEESVRDFKKAYELYKSNNWGKNKYLIFNSEKEYVKNIINENFKLIETYIEETSNNTSKATQKEDISKKRAIEKISQDKDENDISDNQNLELDLSNKKQSAMSYSGDLNNKINDPIIQTETKADLEVVGESTSDI